ncbi:hypothetical protein BDN71DRAFT_1504037 [Pleurotus eryngii]|uniref:Uncharacterized protein n=1 Tax=Pleurotus eryngii TaxID=5323 RepID=A0A9P6A6T9_PLEER|nr:hypothetical protein BDN71DRAFT_1504037 [Pleurotus eryngii]
MKKRTPRVVMYSFAIFLIFQIAFSAALPNDHLSYLAMRQADIPGACADQCIPINSIIALQCTVGKCCTDVFANGYADCVRCFGHAIEITNFAPFQTAIDSKQLISFLGAFVSRIKQLPSSIALFAACSRAGQPIPKLTLPGQDANRVIASTVATTTRVSTASVPAGTASASNSGAAPSSSTSFGSSIPAVTSQAPTQASPPGATVTAPLPITRSSISPPITVSSSVTAASGAASAPPTPSTSEANRLSCFILDNKLSLPMLALSGLLLYVL